MIVDNDLRYIHMFWSQYAGSQDLKTKQVIYGAHFIHNFDSSWVKGYIYEHKKMQFMFIHRICIQ